MKKSNSRITKLSTVLLIIAMILSFSTYAQKVKKDKENPIIIKQDSIELEKRLKELSNTPYTGKFDTLFYLSPLFDDYEYYLCPICGKETRRTIFQLIEVKLIEKIVNQIKEAGYDVVLEQKEYCKYCSRRIFINEPSLIFKIRFSPNSNYWIAKSSLDGDYDCLLQFLIGNKTYYDNSDAYISVMKAIHDNIDVIQKMTGLGSEIIISNPKPKKK